VVFFLKFKTTIESREFGQEGTMDKWQLKMEVTLEEYYQILAQRAEKQGIPLEMGENSSSEGSEESSEESETGKIE
jgi:hypothetical protein